MDLGSHKHKLSSSRKKLLRSILSLPPNASSSVVSKVITACLDSILHDVKDENLTVSNLQISSDDRNQHASISPLMIACERCQVEVIKFFHSQMEFSLNTKKDNNSLQQISTRLPLSSITSLFGHPLDTNDPNECGGNGASHLIAGTINQNSAKTFEALVHFFELIISDFNYSEKIKELENIHVMRGEPSPHDILLGQTNTNRDTPIMIASVVGNIEFLRHTLFPRQERFFISNEEEYSELKSQSNSYSSRRVEQIRKLLSMKNNKNDTALKLAFGHGHYNILQLFTQAEAKSSLKDDVPSILKISNDDANECQHIFSEIENVLAKLKTKTNSTEDYKLWDKKMLDMRRCLIFINLMAEKNVRLAQKELMLLTDKETQEANNEKFASQKKRNKKKNSRRKDSESKSTINNTEVDIVTDKNKLEISTNSDNSYSKSVASPRFVTLEDGSIVGTSVSENLSKSESNETTSSTMSNESLEKFHKIETGSPTSLEKMLQKRFLSIQKGNSSNNENSNLEQLMRSLCLDVSMLLKSSHGMAMDLSPCQLDAVEQLLRDQLNAVMEARKIQNRLNLKNNFGG